MIKLGLIVTIVAFLGFAAFSEAREKSKLDGNVYELNSDGFISGAGVKVDIVINVRENKIILKKADVKGWSPLGVVSNRTTDNYEIPITSVVDKEKSVVIEGSIGEDTDDVRIKVEIFTDRISRIGFSAGMVDVVGSGNQAKAEWKLSLNQIKVKVTKLR